MVPAMWSRFVTDALLRGLGLLLVIALVALALSVRAA
jgi:hypothetical protein